MTYTCDFVIVDADTTFKIAAEISKLRFEKPTRHIVVKCHATRLAASTYSFSFRRERLSGKRFGGVTIIDNQLGQREHRSHEQNQNFAGRQ
jgi:hypothetical protein